jgi:putative hemin transport protein
MPEPAAGSRAVAAALPALGTVVSCTANDSALSHTGEYGHVSHPSEALVGGDRMIAARLGFDVAVYLATAGCRSWVRTGHTGRT